VRDEGAGVTAALGDAESSAAPTFNGVHETVPDILKHYDVLGGPTTYPHYAAGWAVRLSELMNRESNWPWRNCDGRNAYANQT